MPQTYMRTSLARRGLNSSFSPVRELWILSMGLETAARRVAGHEPEQRCKLGTMRQAGQGDSERHVEVRALAAGALFQNSSQGLEVRVCLVERGGGGGEEFRPCGRDDAALVLSQCRQLAVHDRSPLSRVGRQHHIVAHQLDEVDRVARPQPGTDLLHRHPLSRLFLPMHQLRLVEACRRPAEMFGAEMCGHFSRRQPAVDIARVSQAKQLIEEGCRKKSALAEIV